MVIFFKLASSKKGKAHFYFGVGSLFMSLIVIFVFISIGNPELATKITSALGSLFGSIQG